MRQFFLGVMVASTFACTRASHTADSDSAAASAMHPTDTTMTSVATTPWSVSDSGIGPIRAGISSREATALLKITPLPDSAAECAYVNLAQAPGASLMVVKGTVERVDVRDSSIATDRGARVGDSEARIQSLYPAVKVSPHKYTAGHYLTVTPASPSLQSYRLVFETDSGRVTRYRTGRTPAVEWVEGCS